MIKSLGPCSISFNNRQTERQHTELRAIQIFMISNSLISIFSILFFFILFSSDQIEWNALKISKHNILLSGYLTSKIGTNGLNTWTILIFVSPIKAEASSALFTASSGFLSANVSKLRRIDWDWHSYQTQCCSYFRTNEPFEVSSKNLCIVWTIHLYSSSIRSMLLPISSAIEQPPFSDIKIGKGYIRIKLRGQGQKRGMNDHYDWFVHNEDIEWDESKR